MAKTTKTKESVVRYETWYNSETGEVREFAVVDKPYSSDYNFHKLWLEDLAKVLDILGGSKFKVFSHILKIINPYSNDVGFTHRELEEELNVSHTTINDVVKKLIKANFMKKVRIGTYKINPKMLVKGSHDKRVGLMLKYDELEDIKQINEQL
jgi:predicted transcriptional regulator